MPSSCQHSGSVARIRSPLMQFGQTANSGIEPLMGWHIGGGCRSITYIPTRCILMPISRKYLWGYTYPHLARERLRALVPIAHQGMTEQKEVWVAVMHRSLATHGTSQYLLTTAYILRRSVLGRRRSR